MKKFKRPLSLALSVMVIATSGFVVSDYQSLPTACVVEAASTSWNFGDSSFKSLGTISKAFTVNGLRFHANDSKTMQVKAENVTVDGTTFKYTLALGGSGAASYRSVSFENSGSSTIKVTARSSGSSSRPIIIADGSGNKLATITAGTTAALGTASINYTLDLKN